MSKTPARRIGFCIEGDELGGAELAVENLLLAAGDAWDFVLLGPDNASTQRISRTTAVETVLLPSRLEQRKRPDRLRTAIKNANLDLLQVTLCNPTAATLPIVAGLSLGLPVIAVEQLVRPIYSRKRRLLKAALARRFAGHVAVGKASARFTEELCWLRPGTVTTIYNGVAIPPETRSPSRAEFGSSFVTVGRLEHQKGYDVLLAALALVEQAVLTVVGDGSELAPLSSQAKALGIDDRVDFVGWQDDPLPFLRRADVFVSGSRQEAFPHSVVEAMLAGLPVIATDVGSVREAVIPAETGVLVPAEDVVSLADAMASLVGDPAKCAAFGAGGRYLAETQFTDAVMAQEYEKLWGSIR